jgi:hydroxymethylpyrimidine pyrophosphatase-like HAD family hydrolase
VKIPEYRPVLYTDLDDTLFQTARKMTEDLHEDRLAAIATNGHHSYMTSAQERMVGWMLGAMQVIPVTARSTDALSRCQIPFSSWKIAANGAVILQPDGQPDLEWQGRIHDLSAAAADDLGNLATAMNSAGGDGRFRHWIVHEAGMPVYFCAKSNGDEAWLDEITPALFEAASAELVYHRNGNNISFTPRDMSKLSAVTYLDARLCSEAPRFGMGDSLTDLPFMQSCHLMMVPPGSQIATSFRGG